MWQIRGFKRMDEIKSENIVGIFTVNLLCCLLPFRKFNSLVNSNSSHILRGIPEILENNNLKHKLLTEQIAKQFQTVDWNWFYFSLISLTHQLTRLYALFHLPESPKVSKPLKLFWLMYLITIFFFEIFLQHKLTYGFHIALAVAVATQPEIQLKPSLSVKSKEKLFYLWYDSFARKLKQFSSFRQTLKSSLI